MLPSVQIIQLSAYTSFVVKGFPITDYEVECQSSKAYKLILFTEGTGLIFKGNPTATDSCSAGKFKGGDIYLLGSNIPYYFQEDDQQAFCGVVIHFKANFLGNNFLDVYECRDIKQLLQAANNGLLICGKAQYRLQLLLKDLEVIHDMNRIIILLQCLQIMASENGRRPASKKEKWESKFKDQEYIAKIIDFTTNNFQENITLSQVASLVYMSVPSFCLYFKRWMQKTYFDYLNEVRIGNACRMLLETNFPVTDICYDSGFNTSAHFHRQFSRLKETTPLQYRKAFSVEVGNKEVDVVETFGKNRINAISA